MSASERLRALKPVHFTVKVGATDPYPIGAVTLYDVPLSLIADAIEMEERLIFDNGTRSRQQMWRDAEAALLALEEHLEGGEE